MSINPKKQEKLREELKRVLPNPDTEITKEKLNDMHYLKSTIKETMRLAPIAIGNLRQTTKELVLGGYQIPKDVSLFRKHYVYYSVLLYQHFNNISLQTDIIFGHMMLCRREEHFPEPEEFIPERWLRDEISKYSNQGLNPWVYMPFGFGPRSCVGKRLANLELEVVLAKVSLKKDCLCSTANFKSSESGFNHPRAF